MDSSQILEYPFLEFGRDIPIMGRIGLEGILPPAKPIHSIEAADDGSSYPAHSWIIGAGEIIKILPDEKESMIIPIHKPIHPPIEGSPVIGPAEGYLE